MQRHLCVKIFAVLCITFILAGAVFADKPTPRVQRLMDTELIPMTPAAITPMFRLADTCTVELSGTPAWYIYPWVIGDELYKAYQDPSITCEKPYPFTVEFVYFPLVFLDSATIYISVDVESVDLSDPSCPKPGSLLTISPYYEVALPSNTYMITIPLDTPAVVNGPYFVGVYVGAEGTPGNTAVITDNTPVPCVSYNDWGEGWVDLDTVHTTEGDKIFPGRMILYSGGTTGGSGGIQPAPAAEFINPVYNQSLGATVDLWANDPAGSEIIDRARFQFLSGSDWFDIGYDANDNPPLRNGVTPSGYGDGLTYKWNTMGLAEDEYRLRAIVTDTLGRADTAEIPVTIDPTPHLPTITSPVAGQNVCDGITAEVTCPDEDISYVSFDLKSIPDDFTLPIAAISQQLGGNINGDPNDGNYVANGEFGDYCSAPAAAAMAVKYWYDKGYSYILKESGVVLTDVQLMDRLFAAMKIRDNLGAYDEEMVAGFRTYIQSHGDQLRIMTDRTPTVSELFGWMGDYEYIVLLGLSGDPGLWMTVVGSSGMVDGNGYFTFKTANPITATINLHSVKEEAGKLWMYYDEVWSEIDIMVSVVGWDWSVTRSTAGVDAVAADGWSFDWNTGALTSGLIYFLHPVVYDQAGHKGHASVPVYVDCTANGIPGDVNHDGSVDPADIVYLTNFLYLNGPPPVSGYSAADINCDSDIDLSDVIYLFNYLFESGPPPCP